MLASEEKRSVHFELLHFIMLSNLKRKKQHWLLTQYSHQKPLRKKGTTSSLVVAAVTTTGEESRAQVASLQMPKEPYKGHASYRLVKMSKCPNVELLYGDVEMSRCQDVEMSKC